jgi:trehalose/maltose hydrolase-like predicted phosphorylase
VIVRPGKELCLPPPPYIPKIPPYADWRERYEKGHLLFGNSIADVKMPEVANGFVGFQVQSGTFMVAGVYNGDTSLAPPDGPSRRAVFPSYWVQVTPGLDKQDRGQEYGLSGRNYALDLERAVFLTRHNVNEALVEERVYAHLLSPSLLVQEIFVDNSKGSNPVNVSVQTHANTATSDMKITQLKANSYDARIAGTGTGSSGTTRDIIGVSNSAEKKALSPTEIAMVSTVLDRDTLAVGAGEKRTWYVISALTTSLNCSSANRTEEMIATARTIHQAATASPSALLATHTAAWLNRWEQGRVEVEGDLALAQSVNASLYFLLSSMREDWKFGISPGGLAHPDYFGHVFWDMETWMYPPLVSLHPELAYAAMDYRFERQNPAEARALGFGYAGLMYPWESALTGTETSPDGDGTHGHCSANYSHHSMTHTATGSGPGGGGDTASKGASAFGKAITPSAHESERLGNAYGEWAPSARIGPDLYKY